MNEKEVTFTIIPEDEKEEGHVNLWYTIEGYDKIYPDLFNFTFDVEPNDPPELPIINGPHGGKPYRNYTFSAVTTDPNRDMVAYWFDWGDGTNSGWVGPYSSGKKCEASHVLTAWGIYTIKVIRQ